MDMERHTRTYPTTIDMMGERGHPLEPAHLKIANYLISHGK